jgi:hypothetical protein
MHGTAKQVLSLMFRPNETVCVSPNKYGYHSIPLEKAINGPVILVPTADSIAKRKLTLEAAIERIDTSEITMCALNPIKGYREDLNCTAFRNFLVELDTGSTADQLAYVKKLGLPYSAAIFSGNKSVHFLISLDMDLPSEKVYRTFAEWILNVVTLADQNIKNPSRSIRVPGAFREPGKQQLLLEYQGVIGLQELTNWLKKHPEAKPKEKQKHIISGTPNLEGIKPWVCKMLVDGIIPPNRNKKWFTVSVEMALTGMSLDDSMEVLRAYFQPDRDFGEREWETTIRSGFKYAHERKT